jgi:hypothetical protein
MTDRALIFLGSLIIMIGALGVAIWLIVGGQVGTFDGNFLLLSALVVAFAFGLYLKFLIKQALEAVEKKKVAEAAQPQRVTAPSVSEGELVR